MKKHFAARALSILLILPLLLSCFGGCSSADPQQSASLPPESATADSSSPDSLTVTKLSNAPKLGYYEIFVGSFYDSDGDGMGDLQGVIQKLDYLNNPENEDCLGINAIWFMPINPSPTYHKYDVTDYYDIDPAYGTMADFDELLSLCDARGIDIIVDLVLNHSSSQHPWFKEASAALKEGSASPYVDYYNFSETKVGTSYYRVPGTEYWYEAGFWSEMPDLNMDCQELRGEIAEISRFWLEKGVRGFRLDAAKHVYNTPAQNAEFWTWFSAMCKDIREDVFLIAEVWDSDNVMIPYYDTGLSAVFNFNFAGYAGAINQNVSRGDGATMAANIERWDKLIRSRNPDGINSPFLSNHDTDRSAGYITDITQRKLQAAVYLLIPGSPFIYYGEEIGMTGRGRDENKRTAMYWSASDSTGITRNPYGTEAGVKPPEQGVDAQLADPDSLLNYYRAILKLKAKFPDIMDGAVTGKIAFDDRTICAFYAGDVVVLHNFSGETTELDVSIIEAPGGPLKLGGYVCPNGEEAKLADGILTVPPYSSMVLA